eukprot:3425559-Pyramimonas_sp.AAC.1
MAAAKFQSNQANNTLPAKVVSGPGARAGRAKVALGPAARARMRTEWYFRAEGANGWARGPERELPFGRK